MGKANCGRPKVKSLTTKDTKAARRTGEQAFVLPSLVDFVIAAGLLDSRRCLIVKIRKRARLRLIPLILMLLRDCRTLFPGASWKGPDTSNN